MLLTVRPLSGCALNRSWAEIMAAAGRVGVRFVCCGVGGVVAAGLVAGTVCVVELVVHPRVTVSFDEFCASCDAGVALDGYVAGPTVWDDVGHYNFNHHEGTDRFTTRATCEQVALGLRVCDELWAPDLGVHVNDDDPDVALSVWLLEHPELVDDDVVRVLCSLQGAIDSLAGCCSVPRVDDLERLAWVIDPWVEARSNLTRSAGQIASVIGAVGDRISAHVVGCGDRLPVEHSLVVRERRGDVWAISETHPLSRALLVAGGAAVFVSVRELDGRRDVSVGRTSPFVSCDLDGVWDALNRVEDCVAFDRWGGGDMVGGSPRGSGTRLEVAEILDVVAAHRS